MSSERIYLSSPDVTQLEEGALVRAFQSGWIAPLGPEVDAFEQELGEYCGRKHVVALSSGTAALHLGLLALGVGEGDLVLTSSMTFAATTNAIVYTGATPIFVDCDPSGNIDIALLEHAFDTLEGEGLTVKAVVPVDLLGKVAANEEVEKIAAAHGALVLSDAAESLGAIRLGKPSAAYGIGSAVSFNGNKIMTTSGGGAFLTDDKELADKVRYLATQARQPVVHYEHKDVGYNYRLSNILAAMGRAQLSRLDDMIERRRQHRVFYAELFSDLSGVEIFGEPSGTKGGVTVDNFWLTSILINESLAGFSSEDLRLALAEENIEARPLWKPMHMQPIFEKYRSFISGWGQKLFETGLSLPSGSVLTDSEMLQISTVIRNFVENKNAS